MFTVPALFVSLPFCQLPLVCIRIRAIINFLGFVLGQWDNVYTTEGNIFAGKFTTHNFSVGGFRCLFSGCVEEERKKRGRVPWKGGERKNTQKWRHEEWFKGKVVKFFGFKSELRLFHPQQTMTTRGDSIKFFYRPAVPRSSLITRSQKGQRTLFSLVKPFEAPGRCLHSKKRKGEKTKRIFSDDKERRRCFLIFLAFLPAGTRELQICSIHGVDLITTTAWVGGGQRGRMVERQR